MLERGPARGPGSDAGALLKRFRHRAGLTQAVLAEMAGLSARGVQDVERGLSIPRRQTVRRLATALDLPAMDRMQLEAAACPRPRYARHETPHAPRTNLPRALTSFVGRERARLDIQRLLGTTQLLTLTGPGGVGKSRLAVEVASAHMPLFPDGRWLVDLAALSEPSLVVQAVAAACGVRERRGEPLAATLLGWLRCRRVLLVLDNCEHVIEGCAALAAGVLRACRHVAVLATSREALRVTGEMPWRVEPLSVPDAVDVQAPETLETFAACRLFIERARAVHPEFTVTADSARSVAEICRRLDGLPLAIELAAARIRTFPARALLHMLASGTSRDLSLLTGPRDAPARQRSLADTIAWSYDLLSPAEQRLFERISVFRGCTLEAVEAVCIVPRQGLGNSTVALPRLDLDAAAGTLSLVDKSLLRVQEGEDGQPWYVMLETIRAFALARLDASGDGPAVRRRHVLHCLNLVEETEHASSRWPGLPSREEAALFARLEREHANCRAALEWCQAQGYAAISLRLATGLWWFWFARGYATEGRARLASLLERFPPRGRTGRRALLEVRALAALARLVALQGDLAAGRSLFEQALTLAEPLGDGDALFLALEGLGFVASQQADYAAAKASLDRSLAVARRFAGPSKIASALYNLGNLAEDLGNAGAARVLLEESAALYEGIGEDRSLGFVYLALSGVQDDDEPDQGRRLAERALTLLHRCGDRRGVALALARLGTSAIARHEFAPAWRFLQQSLRLQQELDDAPGTALVLDRFAVLEAACGQHVRALHFAGAAAALREQAQTRLLAAAQRALDSRLAPSRRALGNAIETIARNTPPPTVIISETLASTPARRARWAAAVPDHLSPRELEVAALVADGYTNREIAQHLVIAEGTVATHMLHILAKLGFRSRVQVGAWAAAHQLLDDPGTVAHAGRPAPASTVGAAPSSTRGHVG